MRQTYWRLDFGSFRGCAEGTRELPRPEFCRIVAYRPRLSRLLASLRGQSCNFLHSLSFSRAGIVGVRESKPQRRFVLSTGKSIYVGGTGISILISLALYLSGKREAGIFVGLWAPTVMSLGQTLFEDED